MCVLSGMRESLFAELVCIEACIPLIITGPPGTGKTMSYQIALKNLKGASSPSKELQKLKHMNSITYQCSEQSTAAEIKEVYEKAIQGSRAYRKAGITSFREVVFLDEANLPDERKAALKSIHYYTDHPEVMTILLTNITLDAAKTNRGIQVHLSETTPDDLFALAAGVLLDTDTPEIYLRTGNGESDRIGKQLIRLCEAYNAANEFCDIPGHDKRGYQSRDFVYLCRFLRHIHEMKQSSRRQHTMELILDAPSLIHALRRTFNGISKANFPQLVKMFLTKMGLKDNWISSLEQDELLRPDESYLHHLKPQTIDTLRQALQDKLRPGESPNESHFRHIMLIDRSSSNNGVKLLKDLKLFDSKSSEVFTVSDFPYDADELSRSTLISKMKTAIQKGKILVLLNGARVMSAFYDVLNKHYTKQKENYFANICIGSFSRPAIVHRDTKVIIIVSESELPSTPLPLLNRFDKFTISVEDVLEEEIHKIQEQERERDVDNSRISTPRHTIRSGVAFDEDEDGNSLEVRMSSLFQYIWEGVDDFARNMNMETMFYGFVPGETVPALILRCLRDTVDSKGLDMSGPKIRDSPTVRPASESSYLDGVSDEEEDVWEPSENVKVAKRIREFIRDINFQLLQYARPESVFLSRRYLPKSYLKQYVSQEHFSVVDMIRMLSYNHWFKQTGDNKYMAFTRTSADILGLQTDQIASREMRLSFIPRTDVHVEPRRVYVVNINSFLTSAACCRDICDFIHNTSEFGSQRLLIILANRAKGVVSTSMVNLVIGYIDDLFAKLQADSKDYVLPLIFVIQHFPAECLQFEAVYDSLAFNGWDMCYCDSFGYRALPPGVADLNHRSFSLNSQGSDEKQRESDSAQLMEGNEAVNQEAVENLTESLSLNDEEDDDNNGLIDQGEQGPEGGSGSGKGGLTVERTDSLEEGETQHTTSYYVTKSRWFEHGLGISSTLDPADLVRDFKVKFMSLLEEMMKNARSQGKKLSHLEKANVCRTKFFYLDKTILGNYCIRAFRDETSRCDHLEDNSIAVHAPFHFHDKERKDKELARYYKEAFNIISERCYVVDILLRNFTSVYSSRLNSYVDIVAKEQLSGTSIESFLDRVNSSYNFLLSAYSKVSIMILLRNYGLEILCRLPTDDQLKELENDDVKLAVKLCLLILKGNVVPSVNQLLKMSDTSILSMDATCRFAPRIPFFMDMVNQINRVYSQVVFQHRALDSDEGSIEEAVRQALPADLKEAIDEIETNKSAGEWFVHDVMGCYLNLNITGEEMNVALQLFSTCKISVLKFIRDSEIKEFFLHVMTILRPLRGLDSKQFRCSIFEDSENEIDFGNHPRIRSSIESDVIDFLWAHYDEGFKMEDIDDESLLAGETLREICSRFPDFNSVKHRVPEKLIMPHRVAVFTLMPELISTNCDVGTIKNILKVLVDYVNDLDFQDSGCRWRLLREIMRACEAHLGSHESRDVIMNAVCRRMPTWIYGTSFGAANAGDLQFLLAGLGSDSEHPIFHKSLEFLEKVKWIMKIIELNDVHTTVSIGRDALNEALKSEGRSSAYIEEPIHAQHARMVIKPDGPHMEFDATRFRPIEETLHYLVFEAILERFRRQKVQKGLEEHLNEMRRQVSEPVDICLRNAQALFLVEITARKWALEETRGGVCFHHARVFFFYLIFFMSRFYKLSFHTCLGHSFIAASVR